MSLDPLRKELRRFASKKKALILQRFFKTGPGEYGQGDVFIGVPVPLIRKVAKNYRRSSLSQVSGLLRSRVHEERLLALLILVGRFEISGATQKKEIFKCYLKNTAFINNWDLVDLTCHRIVGSYLADKDRSLLYRLARSSSLWERRIAIVSTYHFIRSGEFEDTFKIAALLLSDAHDLMHKAAGWMLREAGKRDRRKLEFFLERHSAVMPRTMLRYALEHFPRRSRAYFMNKKRSLKG